MEISVAHDYNYNFPDMFDKVSTSRLVIPNYWCMLFLIYLSDIPFENNVKLDAIETEHCAGHMIRILFSNFEWIGHLSQKSNIKLECLQ